MLRLIDREHLATALAFCVLAIVFVIAIRMPEDGLREIPKLFDYFLRNDRFVIGALSTAVWVLLVACLLQYAAFRTMRKLYKSELERMAAQKRELEASIDPARPRTYLKDAHAKISIVEVARVADTE